MTTETPAMKRLRTTEPLMLNAIESSAGSKELLIRDTQNPPPDPPATQDIRLVPRDFERLSLTIDPDYVAKLRIANVVGYSRPFAQRHPTLRFYTIKVDNFRSAIINLMTPYLTWKLHEFDELTGDEINQEVTAMVPIIANACMAALYAKLRVIHTQLQTYNGRYGTRPTYFEGLELPLPLADAIQNVGVFTPMGHATNYLCVPTYPENTQNEGRSTQNWPCYSYEAFIPHLNQLGIPTKAVDVNIKSGSPWWTYRCTYTYDHFDLRCIFSPINYSEHSAMTAAMFMVVTPEGAVLPIIEHLPDDQAHPIRLRELPVGMQLNVFSALCHAPCEEWSQY